MVTGIKKEIIDKIEKLGHLKINEPLRNYTTIQTGGNADILICPYNHDSLREIVGIAGEESLPLTVVGGCSNILVGDKGIKGIVIRLGENEAIKSSIRIEEDGLIYADSILTKESFICFCIDNSYEGMEFMAGIPGCIGGGIIMNAGTGHGVFADILDRIVYLDSNATFGTKKVTKQTAGYRYLEIERDAIVMGGFFRLRKSDNMDRVKQNIDENKKERRLKHPLDWPSAGSVFKNPSGHSSWELIDKAGLKGKRIGGALVSDIHTNFIINVDNATSSDILNLINCIKENIYLKFGILLETEIRLLGDF